MNRTQSLVLRVRHEHCLQYDNAYAMNLVLTLREGSSVLWEEILVNDIKVVMPMYSSSSLQQ